MKSKLAVIISVLLTMGLFATPAAASSSDITIQGGPTSAVNSTRVKVDARIYLPEQTPAPAVVLAHGFGGSKEAVADQAQILVDAGYVVVAYSARGFGKTVAPISMNSPQFEVADARAIIDYLAKRGDVTQDGVGDPRVGFAGGSYGGALSLLVAGYDERVDAISSDITWNSLETALFSQSTAGETGGVFKQMWTSYFFSVGMATPPDLVNPCGRFSLEWCLVYQEAVTTGQVSEASRALMKASSPISITSKITAPALLMAGQADSLFPLTELDATVTQIQSAQPETPLKVIWHAGGHDGGVNESERLQGISLDWFNQYLRGEKPQSAAQFVATLSPGTVVGTSNRNLKFLESDTYTGLFGQNEVSVDVSGQPQKIVAPAGGEPALMTVLPGLGGSLASLLGRSLPNQSAFFESELFTSSQQIVGASKVRIRITPTSDVSETALFASLRITSGIDTQRFPNGLVSPIRLTNLKAGIPVEIDVQLPGIVAEVNAGEKLQLVVSTTDAAYKLPIQPTVYEIALVSNSVLIPSSTLVIINNQTAPYVWLLVTLAVILVFAFLVWLRRPRLKSAEFKPEYAEIPMRVDHLVK
ncbi:MAG: hypothetical protein RLZZ426_48, partial [Actinomycetota bacterium]